MRDEPTSADEGYRITFGPPHEMRTLPDPRAATDWERDVLTPSLRTDRSGSVTPATTATRPMVSEVCERCPTVALLHADVPPPMMLPDGRLKFGPLEPALMAPDLDGTPISVYVHTRDGQLAEIEVIRADGRPIQRPPAVDDFYDEPDADAQGIIVPPWRERP